MVATPKTLNHRDATRLARMMGVAWRRHGYDVVEKVAKHAPFWSDDINETLRLAAACLSAAAGEPE
jgi:hypothetical protein